MSEQFDDFRQEYTGTLVGKLFVVTVIATTLIGLGAAGIVGVILMTEVVGWDTVIARTAGFAAGILATLFYLWMTGPVPWRIWDYW